MTTMGRVTDTPCLRPEDADAWRAVQSRNAQYDGRFVYAVRSTRIYCRPSCPSRRPSRENVSFFDTPNDAQQQGYRACLRCEPAAGQAGTAITRAVEDTRAYIERNADRSVPLVELAARVGLSVSHLRRSFKRLVGVSPKEYQDTRRVDRFKTRLRSGDTVSRATFEAGFGSSSRVYERTDALLGMTPASYRRGGAGVHIRYTIANAPVGRVLVAMTERGVCAVALGATNSEVERSLRDDFPNAVIERDDDENGIWVRAILARIRNPRRALAHQVPLDIDGSAFQRQVWKALQDIPIGERRSYREIATTIGRPRATRAVARACATNRVAVVIPCHRVMREDGTLAGYKWGIDRKRQLLDDEQA